MRTSGCKHDHESGLEAKLGAFFEKNPAKRKLAGKRSGVSLADM